MKILREENKPMRKYKDFEDYLAQKFAEQNPMVLDDDWPDMYAEWEADLDILDVIKWANEYAEAVKS